MSFVHETCPHDLVVRIGAALPFIAGVHPAEPPYDAPAGAQVGHGVAIDMSHDRIHVCCYVELDVRRGTSARDHAALITHVITELVTRLCQRSCTVSVFVTDVRTQGIHV